MSDVELVCLGDTAYIQDLGLKMVRGASITTTLTTIAKSRDLEVAKAHGLVSVTVLKAQMIRRDLPSTPVEDSPNQRAISRSATSAANSPSPASGDFTSALQGLTMEVRLLREDLRRTQRLEAKLIEVDAKENPSSVVFDPVLLMSMLRTVLSEFDFGSGNASPSVARTSSTPEAVFIPSGIVTTATKNLDIETSRSTTSGVDDAEEALRNARRRKNGDG